MSSGSISIDITGTSADFVQATNAATQSLDRFVRSISSSIGKTSVLNKTLTMVRGGAAVAGLSLLGRSIKDVADTVGGLRRAMEGGQKAIADWMIEFGKSIPVIGEFVSAGQAIRNIFTGEVEQLRELTKENERVTRAWEAHAAAKEALNKVVFAQDSKSSEISAIEKSIQEARKIGNTMMENDAKRMLRQALIAENDRKIMEWREEAEQKAREAAKQREKEESEEISRRWKQSRKQLEDSLEQARIAREKVAEEVRGIEESTKTPIEKLQDRIKRLDELLISGWLSWDTYAKAAKAAMDELERPAEPSFGGAKFAEMISPGELASMAAQERVSAQMAANINGAVNGPKENELLDPVMTIARDLESLKQKIKVGG